MGGVDLKRGGTDIYIYIYIYVCGAAGVEYSCSRRRWSKLVSRLCGRKGLLVSDDPLPVDWHSTRWVGEKKEAELIPSSLPGTKKRRKKKYTRP